MRLSTTSILLMSMGLAAAEGQTQPTAKPGELCALEGRVVDAVTGEPVKKATITLNPPANAKQALSAAAATLPQQFGTTTDSSGRFAMKDVDAGAYRLQVTRNGYVAGEYGARGPSKSGTVLTLSAGQQAKDLTVKLTPHGVIAGRVLDEDGDPMAGMMVQLLKPGYSGGKKQLSTAGSGSTNDLGEYRIFGLAPGKYYVTAGAAISGSLSVDRSAVARPEEDHVATYYPGVTDAASATPVDVAAGVVMHGIDIAVAKRRTVHIMGKVSAPAKVQMVYLAPRGMSGAISLRLVRVDADGGFEIRGIAAGSYAITGSTQQNGKALSATMPVEVGESNIDGLIFTIGAGVAVTGRVTVDGETAADVSKVKVQLQEREMGMGALLGAMGSLLSGGGMGGETGKLGDDMTFRLENVGSDSYDVEVTGLPDGFYVAAVRSGQVDVLQSGLDVKGAPPEPVEVVLSPHGGQVNGTVRTADHQLAAQATVALVPREKERAGQKAYYFDTAVGQDGTFHIKSVPPGEYGLFAWEDVESGAWLDPDFMKPFDDRGYALTVHVDGQEAADVTAIAAEAGGK
jgi:protocatechuate 3,4-dioxygenase beta subunit